MNKITDALPKSELDEIYDDMLMDFNIFMENAGIYD